MKFVRLKTKNKTYNTWEKPFNEYWCLILRTPEEVMTYIKHDGEIFSQTLNSMRREDTDRNGRPQSNVRLDHLSTHREHVLATFISSKALMAQEEGYIWPHEVLSSIVGGKSGVMLKAVLSGPIQIAQSGGWCHHKTFMELWEPEVTGEIEKNTCAFPNDSPPIKAKYLILENGANVSKEVSDYVNTLTHNRWYPIVRSINELKEKDAEWVAKSIAMSDIIVIETQAVDMLQMDSFMKLFTQLEPKEVLIKSVNKKNILEHPLFETNSKKHVIKFF